MKTLNLFLFFIVLLFLGIVENAAAQNSQMHMLRGIVFDSDSVTALSNSKYVINNKEAHVVNKNGEFLFLAAQGDVVKFTHVGYKPLYMQVDDSLSNNKFLLGVFLSKDTIELSEVIIFPQYVNPNAVARNLPLITTSDEVAAQNNLNRSAYQAKVEGIKVWDADMNQKNFLQARSNDVVYKYQLKPDQVLGISTTDLRSEIERMKIKNDLEPVKNSYLSPDEKNYLKETYTERKKLKELKE